MKVLVLPKPIEGVAREEMLQHAAEALPEGGQRISPNFSPALIRLTPGRILSWNLTSGDPAQTHLARNV